MENEQNQELELDEKEIETGEGKENESEKPKLTPDQLRGIKQRQFTKLAKELGIELPKPEEKKEQKKEDSDYAQLAEESYLNSKGVPEEDHEYIREISKNTGQPLKEVLGKGYVQGELKDRMEARRVSNATPTSTRASGAPRDTVEYWMDKKDEKGESVLPPLDQTELRRKVLNARIKREEQGTKFTNEPVVK